ncbi:hypothetical protein K7X08_021359 [Anisodus acutangulus]|uniref:Uncharacterized protein n=1 Tax=Anisodus acutangulus TaxID=402998 RepID=A0A9Q1M2W2_9SOLA|nr:hypothetical protein K7X08_021359 [Anisodus acutangulus]
MARSSTSSGLVDFLFFYLSLPKLFLQVFINSKGKRNYCIVFSSFPFFKSAEMAEDLSEKLLINGEDQEEKERNTIIVEKEERLGDKILNENKKLWVVAAPAIFTRFSTFGVNVISLAFIGHIGATELAAYALVSTVLLRFCIGIIFKFGLSGAMVSTILAFWIPTIGQLVFVMDGWCKDTWTGFTFLAFKDLLPVVKLSLSSGVML